MTSDYVEVRRDRKLPPEPPGYEWLAPLREAVDGVEYRDWRFTIGVEDNGAPFLQIVFDDPVDGTPQYCRKWLLYVTMNRSEVVRTAWMAVMAAEEHEARERFSFMGRHIMAPHFDVDRLVEFYRWRRNISPTPDPVPTSGPGVTNAQLRQEHVPRPAAVEHAPTEFAPGRPSCACGWFPEPTPGGRPDAERLLREHIRASAP